MNGSNGSSRDIYGGAKGNHGTPPRSGYPPPVHLSTSMPMNAQPTNRPAGRPSQQSSEGLWGEMYSTSDMPIEIPFPVGAPAQRRQSEPIDGEPRSNQPTPSSGFLNHIAYGGAPDSAGAQKATRLSKHVELYENHQMEKEYKDMADLFSIITAVEHLETAWRRNFIEDEDYESECWKLINRFKATKDVVKEFVPDIRRFIEEYNMGANSAITRLLETPIPGTVVFGEGAAVQRTQGESARVGKAVHCFISATDNLRLNFTAVDEVQPHLLDILEHLNKLSFLPPDFEGKVKLKAWLTKFSSMKASENLSDEDVRQLLFDLESSYSNFHRLLDEG